MRKSIAAVLFMMFMTFLALAANPADDVKKADQDWAKAAGSKNVDQFMSFITMTPTCPATTASGSTASRQLKISGQKCWLIQTSS